MPALGPDSKVTLSDVSVCAEVCGSFISAADPGIEKDVQQSSRATLSQESLSLVQQQLARLPNSAWTELLFGLARLKSLSYGQSSESGIDYKPGSRRLHTGDHTSHVIR